MITMTLLTYGAALLFWALLLCTLLLVLVRKVVVIPMIVYLLRFIHDVFQNFRGNHELATPPCKQPNWALCCPGDDHAEARVTSAASIQNATGAQTLYKECAANAKRYGTDETARLPAQAIYKDFAANARRCGTDETARLPAQTLYKEFAANAKPYATDETARLPAQVICKDFAGNAVARRASETAVQAVVNRSTTTARPPLHPLSLKPQPKPIGTPVETEVVEIPPVASSVACITTCALLTESSKPESISTKQEPTESAQKRPAPHDMPSHQQDSGEEDEEGLFGEDIEDQEESDIESNFASFPISVAIPADPGPLCLTYEQLQVLSDTELSSLGSEPLDERTLAILHSELETRKAVRQIQTLSQEVKDERLFGEDIADEERSEDTSNVAFTPTPVVIPDHPGPLYLTYEQLQSLSDAELSSLSSEPLEERTEVIFHSELETKKAVRQMHALSHEEEQQGLDSVRTGETKEDVTTEEGGGPVVETEVVEIPPVASIVLGWDNNSDTDAMPPVDPNLLREEQSKQYWQYVYPNDQPQGSSWSASRKPSTKSCLSSIKSSQKSIHFGSASAMEFETDKPSNVLTHVPSPVAQKRFTIECRSPTQEEAEMTEETKLNSATLAQCDNFVDDDEESMAFPPPRSGKKNRRWRSSGRRSSGIFSPRDGSTSLLGNDDDSDTNMAAFAVQSLSPSLKPQPKPIGTPVETEVVEISPVASNVARITTSETPSDCTQPEVPTVGAVANALDSANVVTPADQQVKPPPDSGGASVELEEPANAESSAATEEDLRSGTGSCYVGLEESSDRIVRRSSRVAQARLANTKSVNIVRKACRRSVRIANVHSRSGRPCYVT